MVNSEQKSMFNFFDLSYGNHRVEYRLISGIFCQSECWTLCLLGSALLSCFNETSDIDLLVQFNQVDLLERYFDNYVNFIEKLKVLFGLPVYLVDNQAIKIQFSEKLLIGKRS